jgi:hypothetical protein
MWCAVLPMQVFAAGALWTLCVSVDAVAQARGAARFDVMLFDFM